jgi:hypothetical protein
MFSTIIAFINLLDYPPVLPACGQYSKGYRSIRLQSISKSFEYLGAKAPCMRHLGATLQSKRVRATPPIAEK